METCAPSESRRFWITLLLSLLIHGGALMCFMPQATPMPISVPRQASLSATLHTHLLKRVKSPVLTSVPHTIDSSLTSSTKPAIPSPQLLTPLTTQTSSHARASAQQATKPAKQPEQTAALITNNPDATATQEHSEYSAQGAANSNKSAAAVSVQQTSDIAQLAHQKAAPDYAYSPAPNYPLLLREQGIGGLVWLRVWVNIDGRAEQVHLLEGSGYRLLDEAALRAVRNWRFFPAAEAGQALASWVSFPIRFSVSD